MQQNLKTTDTNDINTNLQNIKLKIFSIQDSIKLKDLNNFNANKESFVDDKNYELLETYANQIKDLEG